MSWTINVPETEQQTAYQAVKDAFQVSYPEPIQGAADQVEVAAEAAENVALELGWADDRIKIQASGHFHTEGEDHPEEFVSVIVTKLPDAAEAESTLDAEESESRGPGIEGEGQDVRRSHVTA